MKRNLYSLLALALILALYLGGTAALTNSIPLCENPEEEVTTDINYGKVKTKKFPFAVQCWTFRKYTFFEALDKVNELGIKYIEAYPGQKLSEEWEGIRFDHNLDNEMIKMIQNRLREKEMTLVSYGVVGFENNEESIEKVFQFARKLGIL